MHRPPTRGREPLACGDEGNRTLSCGHGIPSALGNCLACLGVGMSLRLWVPLAVSLFAVSGCGSSGPTLTALEVIQELDASGFPCQSPDVSEVGEVTIVKCDALTSDSRFLQVTVYPDATALEAMIESRCSTPSTTPQAEGTQSESSTPIQNGSITAVVTGAGGASLSGVRVTVSSTSGFNGEGVTGADGRATVPVPASGRYTLKLDETTLPADAAVDGGPDRITNVLSGEKLVLFPIVDRTSATESTQGTSTVDVLVGANWWAFGNSNVPSIMDLQQVLGGDVRTVNEC